MTLINLGEMNELALTIQSMRYKEDIAKKMEQEKEVKKEKNANETARREIALELLMQGLSDDAVCRILNISHDQLPSPVTF